MSLAIYPSNPAYGGGIFRRRFRLVGDGRTVTAVLNDDFHSMWCRIEHDGAAVRAIDAEMVRIPKTTCPGAALAVQELVGVALDTSRRAFYGGGRTQRQCTHLLDLAHLAIVHAGQGGTGGTFERLIDIVIPDMAGDRGEVQVHLDDRLIHHWSLDGDSIAAPHDCAGRRLVSGFADWAASRFDGDALICALQVQKAFFVARGRRHIVDQGLMAARMEPEREGYCYSFSEPQLSVAHDLIGYVRDFTDGVDEHLPEHLRSAPTLFQSENGIS